MADILEGIRMIFTSAPSSIVLYKGINMHITLPSGKDVIMSYFKMSVKTKLNLK